MRVKITKNQLKELIRYSIYELTDAEKAKKLGLKSKGFGNWVDPKTGQHYSSKGLSIISVFACFGPSGFF